MPSRAACWPGDTAQDTVRLYQLPGAGCMTLVCMQRLPASSRSAPLSFWKGAAVRRWQLEQDRLGAQAAQLRLSSTARTAAFRWPGIMGAATQVRLCPRSPTAVHCLFSPHSQNNYVSPSPTATTEQQGRQEGCRGQSCLRSEGQCPTACPAHAAALHMRVWARLSCWAGAAARRPITLEQEEQQGQQRLACLGCAVIKSIQSIIIRMWAGETP